MQANGSYGQCGVGISQARAVTAAIARKESNLAKLIDVLSRGRVAMKEREGEGRTELLFAFRTPAGFMVARFQPRETGRGGEPTYLEGDPFDDLDQLTTKYGAADWG